MLRCLFSTTESEKKKKKGKKKTKKTQKKAGCHRKRSSPRAVRVKVAGDCFHSQLVPGREVRAARFLRGGRVPAENTYWAEPTLLSLFPSTLAGFVSSTSCCSSVIGAAAGGHLQTSARLASAPARPPPSGATVRGAGPASPAAHPGQARAAGRQPGHVRATAIGPRERGRTRAGGEGKGGSKRSDSLFPQPRRRRERKRKPVELVFLGEEANWPSR